MYAVILLDAAQRVAAYSEFARVLNPGGHALVAFHSSDADFPVDGEKELSEWWGKKRCGFTFRFLDPVVETQALAAAGLDVIARLDRGPRQPAPLSPRPTARIADVPTPEPRAR